jgi:hypothetical protein
MAVFLMVIGFGWAIIGFWNIIGMLARTDVSSGVGLFGFLLNMILFILPGLAIGGLGALLQRRNSRPTPMLSAAPDPMDVTTERINCRECGESIALLARTCRFCGTPLVNETGAASE